MGEDSEGQEGPRENQLLQARRRKLESLREQGIEPFPHCFEGVRQIADVREQFSGLAPGSETEVRFRLAGRLAARRGHGASAFLDLVDRSGRLQLQARTDVLGDQDFALITSLDLGDLLGVEGTVFATRRGELSLLVEAATVLAKSLRPPPDKHSGLADVETRLRYRELDLIADPAVRERFATRARTIAAVRRFLDDHRFIEVETPVLQPLYGGAAARPFTTHYNALDRTFYLRIATELYLKRCIVGGLERVYELGKDFRNEGLSPKHNPEFTVLEFYEAYADYHDIAARLEQMLAFVSQELGAPVGSGTPEISFAPPWQRETLREAIQARTGVDILADDGRDAGRLAHAMRERGLQALDGDTWAQLVDELISKHVEPTLIEPTLLFDYPVELSPFAKAHRSQPGLVERFEAFCNGIEIANAFTELNDPDEQRARFDAQRAQAAAGDDAAQPYDESFLQALEHGMPPTGGLGLGIDRLVMILTGQRSIREVVLFPAMRDK
ncbi:MAG: lysine--tRNA ligase [Solirubrobacteraceae bacterium]|nr:MAG: lysine--tRNA ligase [Solirubrobacterales bacterium]